ncbi:MAG TPA: hypothetical protein VMQ76_03185 [Terracidiphilus sp.]|nr:hypothetical protein [Terracidiphilus sp.]
MLKRFMIACSLCLALSAISPLAAQYVRVGGQDQIAMGKLDEMEQLIGPAAAGQTVDLLTRMGIDPVISKMVVEELLPGQKIELKAIRAHHETHYGVAFLPSFRGCYLYLLQGADDDPKNMPWHVIDKQDLNCWNGPSVLELMALRRDDADDLVVHNVNYNHGSGVEEDQTQVFSILNGKLVQTLVTQDFLSEVTLGTEITTEHRSTFLRFPDLSLEETRTIAVNDKLEKVERRYWRWSEQKHRFLPGRFVSIVAPGTSKN